MLSKKLTAAVLFCLGVLPMTQAQWQSVGSVQTVQQHENVLHITTTQQQHLELRAISDDVVRIRFSPRYLQPAEQSFSVLPPSDQFGVITVNDRESDIEWRSASLRVVINKSPLRISVFDKNGRVLLREIADTSVAVNGEQIKLWSELAGDQNVYGFGEKNGGLSKRSRANGGYHYTMWNSDTYAYDSATDPIYVSVPFYMVTQKGKAHGIFLDNSFRSSFDIGRERPDALSMSVNGGELNLYVINGPHPKEVIARYTALTGRMMAPPRWALGFHQSRWSYFPDSRLRLLADTFRQKRIPADTLWLDIDYLDSFTPFVWNREYFPQPKKLLGDLRAQGFHVVSIVDPHPKKQSGYHVFDQGVAGDHFVRNADGSLFEGPVWPSNDPVNPRNSVFPDFTQASTRKWWGDLHADLLRDGISGIWNDMNEPAVWIPPFYTMPTDVQHSNDGRPTTQKEIHNVYGMLHTRATHEGLLRLQPDTRPFVLTRATFAGGQRYAAVWSGDNTADWASLRQSLPMLMNMGLSGFSFVGADVGGFAGYPTPELFTRWLQAASFTPFFRAHTEKNTPDQEAWSFGMTHEQINRRTIEKRYQWLPHIYQEMVFSSQSGIPAMRPLFLEFPDDTTTWSRDDLFMLGQDLLIAPVLVEQQQEREVHLPASVWFDAESGERFEGPRSLRVPVTLNSLPIFVRAGAFTFKQPVVQHTGEMVTQPLLIDVYPATQSTRSWYDDDGATLGYQRGEFVQREFKQVRNDTTWKIDISATRGQYSLPSRVVQMQFIDAEKFNRLQYNGKSLASSSSENCHVKSEVVCWYKKETRIVLHYRDNNASIAIRLN